MPRNHKALRRLQSALAQLKMISPAPINDQATKGVARLATGDAVATPICEAYVPEPSNDLAVDAPIPISAMTNPAFADGADRTGRLNGRPDVIASTAKEIEIATRGAV